MGIKIEVDKYAPPKISAHELWSMDVRTFNKWREENDFPRIVQYFIDKLPLFEKWMEIHNLERNQLIKHSPARFIRPMGEIYLYELIDENDNIEFLSYDYHNKGDTEYVDNRTWTYTSKKNRIIPYLKWARGQKECMAAGIENKFFTNKHTFDRKKYFFEDLELLDYGNIRVSSDPFYILTDRNLEFVNIDDLVIDNAMGHNIRVWYSSAINLSISGVVNHIEFYKIHFLNISHAAIILQNGNFQKWKFTDCNLMVSVTNSKIWFWKTSGYNFDITVEHSNIRECSFSEGLLKYSWEYGHAREFHHKMKILYSQLGKNKEAGNHYYLEKEFDRKLLFEPDKYYYCEYLKHRHKLNFLDKFILYPKAILKSISFFAQKLLWGYGEKPIRIFYSSGFIIFGASLFYYINPASDTHYNFFNSVYSSITTFTTIGTGDIKNLDNFWLKIFVGVEALLGIALMGLLIAGFASKSKDY